MRFWSRMKTAAQLLCYYVGPRESAVYSGFDGFDNLGDEVLIYAIRKAFQPYKLCSPPRFANRFFKSLLASRRHTLAILGGER